MITTKMAMAAILSERFHLRDRAARSSMSHDLISGTNPAFGLSSPLYKAGVAGLTDVLQAKTQLNSTQTQLADAFAQRAQLEHALAVLLGVAPSDFKLQHTATLPAKVTVPASLPSTLLERRPDIEAARKRLKAAYAQVGVTDAALFPTLNLSADAGYGQTSIANLLSAPNLLWNVGVGLTQSIFDGGMRQQASAQARANAEQVMSTYRQLVLTALQEVEDNLVLANRLQDEVNSQTEALSSAQRNLEIIQEQYRAGTVSYLNVSTAQSTALNAEIALVVLRNRQLATTNILLKNIAGRW